MALMQYVKGLTLWHAVVIAAVAILAGMFVFRSGLLNTLAWVVAIAALAVGAVNKLSYS